jgi:hypothetical protein
LKRKRTKLTSTLKGRPLNYATLEVDDDYVYIDSLMQTVQHPPFGRDDMKTPLPPPQLEQAPPKPTFIAPSAPTGLSKMFTEQKHGDDAARAHAAWAEQHKQWAHHVQRVLPAKNAKLLESHAAAEQQRAEQLADSGAMRSARPASVGFGPTICAKPRGRPRRYPNGSNVSSPGGDAL